MSESNESYTPNETDGAAADGDTPVPAPHHRWRPGGRSVVAAVALGALLIGGTGLGLALSAGASTPSTTLAGCASSLPRLTVQGTGQANGTPDLLTAVFGFTSTAGTATAALSQDNADVNQALLALADKGVKTADVQTTGLTLAPQYVYPKGVPVLSGYQVTNTVTAMLRDTNTAGDAIDAVVGATGDAATINSLTFSFANPAKVEDQARTLAVHQAVAHAGAMAAAAGRRLGAVCSLTDNTQPSLYAPNAGSTFEGATANAGASPVPVEPGSQTETDQVTIVYALRSR